MKEKDLFKILKSEKLTEAEKSSLRQWLLDNMEENSVRQAIESRLYKQEALKRSLILRPMPIFLALALLFSGGTAYAAQSALPGDTLYPVKVEINENVRGWFKFSGESKAEWNAHLIEERLEEAEALAAEGRLDEKITAQVESRFDLHAKHTQEKISKLQEEGKLDVAARLNSRLASSLEIHEQILSNLRDRLSDADFEPLLDRMRLRLENASDTQAEIRLRTEEESDAGRQTAAERLGLAVKTRLDRVANLFEDKKAELEAETIARIETQLTQVNQEYNEGQRLFAAADYAGAFNAYLQANRSLVHITALIHANADLPVRLHLETGKDLRDEMHDRIRLRIEDKLEFKTDRREDEDEEDDDSDESHTQNNSTIIETPNVRSETHVEVRANSGGNQIRSNANIEIE